MEVSLTFTNIFLTKHKEITEQHSNQEWEIKLGSYQQPSKTYSFPRSQSKHHALNDLKQKLNHTNVPQSHRNLISQQNREG